jgi:hypothetical protein
LSSDVITNDECIINFSTIIASPYNYNGGESVNAKVVAVNVYGESEQSTEGNGAVYYRIPDAPINLAEDTSIRTNS